MDIMGALSAFGKSITEGDPDSKKRKKLTQSELKSYEKFLDTLSPTDRAKEEATIRGMPGDGSRNKRVRDRIAKFGSATTKEVERQRGRTTDALAKGGSVRRKMNMGGKVHRGRSAQGNKA